MTAPLDPARIGATSSRRYSEAQDSRRASLPSPDTYVLPGLTERLREVIDAAGPDPDVLARAVMDFYSPIVAGYASDADALTDALLRRVADLERRFPATAAFLADNERRPTGTAIGWGNR